MEKAKNYTIVCGGTVALLINYLLKLKIGHALISISFLTEN